MIVDPVAAALRNAPVDDEPETEEEKQAVAEARERLNGKRAVREEKTRNGILSTLRIRQLCSAGTLDDIQDRILAQPEPMAYFPVRLAFTDELQHFGRVTV
jgi:hypothetical protein